MSTARLGVTRLVIIAAAILALNGCGTEGAQHRGTTAIDEEQAQTIDGYHVLVTTGGGESTNGIWHVDTTGCNAFLWIDAKKKTSAGVCLRRGQKVAPSVRCEADDIVIETQLNTDAKWVRLIMNNGQTVVSSVIRVPVKNEAPLAYYYQVVPRSKSAPQALDEITGRRSESLRKISLPAERGCGPRELEGRRTKGRHRAPKASGTTYES